MMQRAERNEEIERVRGVFSEYIENSPYLELVWSEKLGYILMLIRREAAEILESRVIQDAGSLCRYLVSEISQNVLEAKGKEPDTYGLEPADRAEIGKMLMPYRNQLPEYGSFFE